MSTYSTNLKIELIGTGEQAGTWGVTTDDNFSNVFEQSIVGRVTVPFTDADVTLTATNSVSSQSFRNVYLNCTGTNTASRNLIVPTINKNYVVQNNTTGGFNIVVKTSAGTGITVPNGKTCTVYADGTNVIQAFDYLPTATLGSPLITTSGGTGLSSYTAGDLTYYASGTALSKLAIGTNGYILKSTGSAPTWVDPTTIIGGAGGSNTQVQYNSSGSLAGSANLTFNGTALTLANDASISGLTVGKGGGAVGTNTAFGNAALAANTSGASNVAIGYQAAISTTSASGIVAVGRAALQVNTTGTQNIAVGSAVAGVENAPLQANTTGNYNIALGSGAAQANTTGSNNVAVGNQALYLNTTASNNTAVGYQAGYSNTTGAYNTFIGFQAGYTSNYNGSTGNTFVGDSAGYAVTTGYGNAFFGGGNPVGNGSGSAITTGNLNTIIGSYTGNQGGLDIRTASNYIVLSDGAGNPKGIFDNLGNLMVGTTNYGTPNPGFSVSLNSTSTDIRIGHLSGTPSGNYYAAFFYNSSVIGTITQAGTTGVLYNVTSDYRLKDVVGSISDSGSRIDAVQPINYTMKTDGSAQRGFLAHQFQAIYPNSVSGEKDAVDAEGKPVYQAMQASSPEAMADIFAELQSLRKRVATLEAK